MRRMFDRTEVLYCWSYQWNMQLRGADEECPPPGSAAGRENDEVIRLNVVFSSVGGIGLIKQDSWGECAIPYGPFSWIMTVEVRRLG